MKLRYGLFTRSREMAAPAPTRPMPRTRGKLRPLAPVNVFDGASNVSSFARPSNADPLTQHPLARVQPLPKALLFMRIEGSALLLSKLPGAEREKCVRVLPLASVRGVRPVNQFVFELTITGTPPMRLEAAEAWVSAARLLARFSLSLLYPGPHPPKSRSPSR